MFTGPNTNVWDPVKHEEGGATESKAEILPEQQSLSEGSSSRSRGPMKAEAAQPLNQKLGFQRRQGTLTWRRYLLNGDRFMWDQSTEEEELLNDVTRRKRSAAQFYPCSPQPSNLPKRRKSPGISGGCLSVHKVLTAMLLVYSVQRTWAGPPSR